MSHYMSITDSAVAPAQRQPSRLAAPAPLPRPPAPREHGAWGILLIPFATAVGAAGVWNLPVALLLVSVLCFYVARTSWLKGNWGWTARLLGGSALAAAPLLVVWQLWWLLAFGLVAAPLGFRKTQRNIPMQLLAIGGLTLTAPAAWYAATGTLGRAAVVLWGLNALYFAGGVFYVKMHLAAAMNRGVSAAVKANLLYHGGVALTLLAATAVGWLSYAVVLVFAPALGRACVGAARLSPVLRIKRLGWTEVAWSLVYAVGLIVATRLSEVL